MACGGAGMTTSFTKNKAQEIRVTRRTWEGYELLDIRLWYRKVGEEGFYPSKKGLTIRAEQAADLIEAIEEELHRAEVEAELAKEVAAQA